MENIRRYPPAAEHLLRYSAVILGIIAALVIAFLAGGAIPAKAAETNANYAQLYQEAIARIDTLEQACAEQTALTEAKDAEIADLKNQLAEKSETVDAQALLLAQQDEEIISLQTQLTDSQQETQRIIDLCGTIYYVDYEVRHKGLICPEASMRHQTIVDAETYKTLRKGDELPPITSFYSGPTGSNVFEWTAVIVDLDTDTIWDANP